MAFTGIVKRKEFEKAVEELRLDKKEYYKNLIPKEKLEHYNLKAVYGENEVLVPAIHTQTQDIYIVLEGKAKFTYKGKLVGQYTDDLERDLETIRGKGIEGGETFEIAEGDVVSIPPGTAHSVDATNSKITFIAIKIDNVK